ncbi:Rv3235 family protein [Longispora albida]|uniref:Rv3235 family protein n=1 Tax=Longispora albida TaxID=203523 RepID=UPI000367ECA8|nr:Rv3235 family protein [Longispora albida]
MITVGPVPPCEPPYEQDECCAGHCCGGRCLTDEPTAHYPRAPRTGAGRRPAGPAGTRPRRTRVVTEAEGPAQRAAAQFLQLYREVLTGHRTPPQLSRRCTPAAYQKMLLDLSQQQDASGPVALQSLRVFSPVAGIVEAVAMLSRAGRIWAMTLRLEKPYESWICTYLEAIRPTGPRKPDLK